MTHVFERSFNASGKVSLLRSSSLRNWPPRDNEGDLVEVVDRTHWLGSDLPVAGAPARRSRVRSLRGPGAEAVEPG